MRKARPSAKTRGDSSGSASSPTGSRFVSVSRAFWASDALRGNSIWAAQGVGREDQAERDGLQVVEPEIMGVDRAVVGAVAGGTASRAGAADSR